MPRQNIGKGEAIFQSEAANGDDYRKAGTLEGWQSTIGAWCEGNPKYPLELFQRVVTVSLETQKIVNSLPTLNI